MIEYTLLYLRYSPKYTCIYGISENPKIDTVQHAAASRTKAELMTPPPRPVQPALRGLDALSAKPPSLEIKGPSGRIYKGTSACGYRPADAPRRLAIRLVESRPFDPLILVTIICNCATMAWESPLDPCCTQKAAFIDVRCPASDTLLTLLSLHCSAAHTLLALLSQSALPRLSTSPHCQYTLHATRELLPKEQRVLRPLHPVRSSA